MLPHTAHLSYKHPACDLQRLPTHPQFHIFALLTSARSRAHPTQTMETPATNTSKMDGSSVIPSPLTPSGALAATESNDLSLGASVANSPLFKLPPELRNRIYGFVFGAEKVMWPDIPSWRRASWANQWQIDRYDMDDDLGPCPDPDFAIQTSILAVCQFVKAEAIEVLYDTKIIRGSPIDLDIMLQSDDVCSRVRRIEINGLLKCTQRYDHDDHDDHARQLRHLLERLQRLPRLHSILILSDCLSPGTRCVSVMDFVREAELEPATCIDVGRYQLHGKFKHIQIVDSKLVKMWPAVRDTPEDYNGVEDAVAIIDSLQSSIEVANVPVWASHTSLRCWVDIQQRFLALKVSGEWDRLRDKQSTGAFDHDDDYTDDEFTFRFFMRTAHLPLRLHIENLPLLRSGEHVLKRLQPNSDSNVLNHASHFLAVNTAQYNRYTRNASADRRYEVLPIAWGMEGKGEQTRLEYMAEQQSIALSGGASKEFVLDPTVNDPIPARNLIAHEVFMRWLHDFNQKDWTDGIYYEFATSTQMKQLTHLHMAVLQPFSLNSDDQHRRDDWAKGLIVRYMVASSRLRQNEVERTSLGDLRTIMSIALDAFNVVSYGDGRDWLRSLSCGSAVPPDFDDDVYPGLGWKYGPLLAKAFERYTSQGRVSKTLAR